VKEADLSIREENGFLILIVEDRGSGFDFEEYKRRVAAEKHFGLINMRERIELNGGTFTIESSVETGTRITATLPIGDK